MALPPKTPSPREEIVDLKVQRISLCKHGANRFRVAYKSGEKEGECRATVQVACKSLSDFDEKGQILGIVAAPGLVDDQAQRIATAQIVEKAAHGFLIERQKGGMNIEHLGAEIDPQDAAVVESFIVTEDMIEHDSRFKSMETIDGQKLTPGSWATVTQLGDRPLKMLDGQTPREAFKSGLWDGLSLEGPSLVQKITAEKSAGEGKGETPESGNDSGATLLERGFSLLRKAFSSDSDAPTETPTTKDSMDDDKKQDPKALTAEDVAGIVAAELRKALVPAGVDATDAASVAQHLAKMETPPEVSDWNDLAQVKARSEWLQKQAEAVADEDTDEDVEDDVEDIEDVEDDDDESPNEGALSDAEKSAKAIQELFDIDEDEAEAPAPAKAKKSAAKKTGTKSSPARRNARKSQRSSGQSTEEQLQLAGAAFARHLRDIDKKGV